MNGNDVFTITFFFLLILFAIFTTKNETIAAIEKNAAICPGPLQAGDYYTPEESENE